MADMTRRAFLRHLRSTPTRWIRHTSAGKVRREGVGQSFWFRPLTAVLSEVPVDDRELPLLFHARTADFADVTVQATVTYRIAAPEIAVARLDFSIDPYDGAWRGQPLDQLATLLAELAQQPALDLLARMPLTEALTAGVAPVRDAITGALASDPRLDETGVAVVSARVVAIRPEPELERALQTPTRESVQQDADKATYERRAVAVERERAIAENELQSKIELARREQDLVEQRGANGRRRAELDADTALVTVQAEAERDRVAATGAAERARLVAEAEADRTRVAAQAEADRTRLASTAEAETTRTLAAAHAERDRALAAARAQAAREIGLAEAEAETARLAAYTNLPPAVLYALAVRELAGQLPEIGQLTVTPDVLTGLLTRLTNGPN